MGHDSTFNVADISTGTPAVQTVKLPELPLVRLLWLNDNTAVGVGHDCNPFLFTADAAGKFTFVTKMDKKTGAAAGAQKTAFNVFKDKVNLGQSSGENDTVLETKHQNCITYVFYKFIHLFEIVY